METSLQFHDGVQLKFHQHLSQRYYRTELMNHVTHPLSSGDISIFSLELGRFCYIKKYGYRLRFVTFNFCWVSKHFVNKPG